MDINFDLGVGNQGLMETLGSIRAEFIKLREEAATSRKEAEQGFQKMSQAGEEVNADLVEQTKLLKSQAQVIDTLNKKLAELEKEKGKAFSTDEMKKQEAEIKRLSDELKKLKEQMKGVGEEGKKVPKQMTAEYQTLLGVLDAAKDQLTKLKPDSAAFNKLTDEIKATEVAIMGFDDEVDQSGDSLENAKKKLKDYVVVLQNLKLAGLDNTDAYKNLKKEAGELKDTIGDVAEEIAAAGSDTSGIDKAVRGVELATNAYGAFEGIMTLTGQRNEDMEKQLVKLNAIMTISGSIQQVMTELKRKDNVITGAQIALQKLYTLVTTTSTTAVKGFRTALASTGIGILLIAIGVLIGKLMEWGDASEETAKKSKQLNDELERQNELVNGDIKAIQRVTNETVAFLESTGAKESDIQKVRINALKDQQKVRQQDLIDKTDAYNKSLNLDKEAMDKAYAELVKAQEAVRDVNSETTIAKLNLTKTINKEIEDANKEAADKQKERDDKAAQALEERNKRILELEKQLIHARIAIIADARDKQIAEENATSAETLSALRENYGKAYGREKQLIQANIEQEQKNHNARLLAIDIDYFQKATEAVATAQESITDVFRGDKEQEQAAINERFAGILKNIEDAKAKIDEAVKVNPETGTSAAGGNTLKLLKQREDLAAQIVSLTEEQQKEIQASNDKFALQDLQKQEEIGKLKIDLLKADGLTEEQLTEFKEQQKLRVTIDYAEQQLAILKASGDEQNEAAILALEKTIQEAQNKLKGVKKPEGFDLFKSLGLDMSEEEKTAFMDGFKTIASSISDIWKDSIDARVEESQRLIDQLEEQISKQEEVVDREKELMEKGRANSFDVEQKKLDDLEAQKAKEKEELEKAQKNQAKIAAAQIAINGILAASQLAVSAANFFASSSKYGPIVGTVLALAAIATMLTTFIAAKRQAQAGAQQAQSFDQGGGIDLVSKGSSHQAGGVPFYDGATGKKIGEARQGEYGYFFKNGRKAKMYEPLFELINSDMGFSLDKIGLSIPRDKKVLDGLQTLVVNTGETSIPYLQEQTKTLKAIATNTEKNVVYYNGYRVETEKNRTRKIVS